MSRLYDRYADGLEPLQCLLTNSKWYREDHDTMVPKGILLHDTSSDNVYIHRYVMPADDDPNRDKLIELLGKNPYNNDWNHGGKDKDAGVSAFVGAIADGKTVTSIQSGAWNKEQWGCGSGRFGSLNKTHIQWEICQDNKQDVLYFKDVYEESIQLAAYLCKLYNIDPHGTFEYKGYKIPTICCHWDAFLIGWNGIRIGKTGCKGGFGSGHTDIYDWDAMYDFMGLSQKEIYGDPYKIDPYDNPVFNRIRDDIAKAMIDPVKQTGWVKESGKWYYYDTDGKMVKADWIKYANQWYYLGDDGVMLTGWQEINGKRYYLYADGHMASGEWVDGYWLNCNGPQIYPHKAEWKENEKGKWWEDASGWFPFSRDQRIDGKVYNFNSRGYLI